MDDQQPIVKVKRPYKKKVKPVEMLLVQKLTQEPLKPLHEVATEVYGGKPALAVKRAHNALSKPEIQLSIREAFEERYPDVAKEGAEMLARFMRDETLHPKLRMQALAQMAEYLGWHAPKTTKNLSIKADLSRYKLPGE